MYYDSAKVSVLGVESLLPFLAFVKTQLSHTTLMTAVNDRKCVFHFRPKPNIRPEKYLALGQIPKPKPKVQIYVKIGGIVLKFNVSNDLSN